MYHKESRPQRIDAFELWCWSRLLRVPWTTKRSNPSILKGNQPWIFTGRTDAKTESPILWPPGAKRQHVGKDPDVGKGWREKKRVTEDEMVGWHHWFNGYELGQTLGGGKGQWSLMCCSPRGSERVRHGLATEQPPPPPQYYSVSLGAMYAKFPTRIGRSSTEKKSKEKWKVINLLEYIFT